jgi:hypothetical protein
VKANKKNKVKGELQTSAWTPRKLNPKEEKAMDDAAVRMSQRLPHWKQTGPTEWTREGHVVDHMISSMVATGCNDVTLADAICFSAANAMGSKSGGFTKELSCLTRFLTGIQPADELEAILISQFFVCSNVANKFLRKSVLCTDPEVSGRYVEKATKLQRTMLATVETLNRHRGKGQQKVTVEHVTVNAGGQAMVVGAISATNPSAGGDGSKNGG